MAPPDEISLDVTSVLDNLISTLKRPLDVWGGASILGETIAAFGRGAKRLSTWKFEMLSAKKARIHRPCAGTYHRQRAS